MKKSQILIVGGGLAGLTAAIDLCKNAFEVILVEKNKYPHHKVCGEYLSAEVLPYLEYLGIDLKKLNAPEIDRLQFSSISGKVLKSNLDLGGFGISRYTLDHYLYEEAKARGCTIIHDSVQDISFKDEEFQIKLSDSEIISSKIVLGAFGKRSSLDKKMNRNFIKKHSGWLAVKAHYENEEYPNNLVSLHNFDGGYCGLSRTEMNTVNVCYLASYKSFRNFKNTEDFKRQILMKNPRLKEFFDSSEQVFQKELSIAQVSFEKKALINDHILMIGDAAGLIHPLCGNGMAMAMHSAKIAAEQIREFYKKDSLNRDDLELKYSQKWKQEFGLRLRSGRMLQKILLNQNLAELSYHLIKTFPALMPQIIKRTHGEKIYV